MRQPWYRSDLFARCKTGEVIEPVFRTLSQKLRSVAIGLAVALPFALAAHWFFKVWTPRYFAELDALAKVDPVESAHKLVWFVSLELLVPVVFGVCAGTWVIVVASRVIRAGRWPLPGAKVLKRTEVVGGWCARLPAVLLATMVLVCLVIAWNSYVQLAAMFWNRYLENGGTF